MNESWHDLAVVFVGALGSTLGIGLGGVFVVWVRQRAKKLRYDRARENAATLRRGKSRGQTIAARSDRKAANAERRAAAAERRAAEAIHGSVLTMTRLFQDQFGVQIERVAARERGGG